MLCFFFLVFLHKFIHFYFFLLQNFILFAFVIVLDVILFKICINFFNVVLIRPNDSLHFESFFLQHFNLNIILLNPILQSLSSLWQWQIQIIGLKLKISLLLDK